MVRNPFFEYAYLIELEDGVPIHRCRCSFILIVVVFVLLEAILLRYFPIALPNDVKKYCISNSTYFPPEKKSKSFYRCSLSSWFVRYFYAGVYICLRERRVRELWWKNEHKHTFSQHDLTVTKFQRQTNRQTRNVFSIPNETSN